jgi:uncharacterized protein YggT (Ycf19 family)
MSPLTIFVQLVSFYEILIIVYVLMSWFRPTGFFAEVYRTLGTIVEPWIGLFRRIVPPLGMIDISPLVALIALRLITQFLVRILG